MNSPSTFEFVSPEWIAAVQTIVTDLLAGYDLAALDYCLSENLTNPPPGRANTAEGTLSWFLRIRGGAAEVGGGCADHADVRILADYTVHHRLSRHVWAGDPEAIALAQQRRQRAAADGSLRVEGDLAAAPDAVRQLIAHLHDPVAVITA